MFFERLCSSILVAGYITGIQGPPVRPWIQNLLPSQMGRMDGDVCPVAHDDVPVGSGGGGSA